MSSAPRSVDDRELDRLLTRWFADGPETAPPRVAEGALASIMGIRQSRAAIPAFGRLDRRTALAWAAVLLVVVLTAVALITGAARVVDLPAPSPVSTPFPSPASETATRLVTDAEAGYQFLMPDAWTEVQGWPLEGSRRFAASDGNVSLTISYGVTIGGGGDFVDCLPGVTPLAAACATDGIRYPIPFDHERAVADLAGTLQPLEGEPFRFTSTPTTLAGASATRHVRRTDDPAIGRRVATYVMSIHDYRPIVLFWDATTDRADESLVETMRSSFRFLDAEPADDPMALVPYRDPDGRFELLMPAFWLAELPIDSADGSRSTTFHGASGDYAPLVVRMGGQDGSYISCKPVCDPVKVASLADLDDAVNVAPSPNGLPGGGKVTHDETTLDGVPAHIASVAPTDQIWGPPTYYAVYAIHDGRPVVLLFDHWAIRMDILPSHVVREIVASFRFLDGTAADPATELVTYRDPAGRFEILVPPDWTPSNVRRGGVTTTTDDVQFGKAVDRAYGALTISVGEPDGSLVYCAGEAWFGLGDCADVVARSLDDLAAIAVVKPDTPESSMVVREKTTLGGEPAGLARPQANHILAGAPMFELVYAIHKGRPVVLTFDHYTVKALAGFPAKTLRAIIASFRFLD